MLSRRSSNYIYIIKSNLSTPTFKHENKLFKISILSKKQGFVLKTLQRETKNLFLIIFHQAQAKYEADTNVKTKSSYKIS
ncbi:hypothetical protein J2W57_001773 [Chryseobacterium ginsenosidimutans]|uniref:Uncharacterized protein n=1 Tax=Chryseobacterium geocarposphaerae TaxID=1416776 RepID=A0ABU1LBI1_9FLAO|nr:hypothetical protein [Chryseobacterium geocarposphaerae]MDR6698401.1 hypothetical protein [Chryseobacterium ginsenosidimutans]